jgi:hypothetical protein
MSTINFYDRSQWKDSREINVKDLRRRQLRLLNQLRFMLFDLATLGPLTTDQDIQLRNIDGSIMKLVDSMEN